MDTSLYNMLSGSQGSDSTDAMYNILLSSESASMMQANPSLVQEILSAGQTSASSSTSSGSESSTTTTQELVQELENMNFLTISPDNLMSLLQNNAASQDTSGTTSGSTVSQTA